MRIHLTVWIEEKDDIYEYYDIIVNHQAETVTSWDDNKKKYRLEINGTKEK